jgi:heat shock protein HtpX
MLNVYEQVSRNKTRSSILIGLFILFITTSVLLITNTLELDPIFTLFAFVFSVGSSLVSYFYGDKIVLGLNGAKLASRQAYFDYYTVVENLSLASQIPMPKIYVIKSISPNAFATGNSPKSASICVTAGLLEKLNRSELEAVIAHELSHIKNYDIRVMTIVSVLLGTLTILIRSTRTRSTRKNKGSSAVLQAIGLILIIFAPLLARLIQLVISRQREYLADSSGVKLTRQPQSLISALQKISSDPNPLTQASTATASLYISNPFKNNKLASLFSTHPPIEKRIKALKQML